MSIQYRMNILDALKKAGYNTYQIRKEGLIGEAALMNLRKGEMVSMKTIDTLCRLLGCQPGDILMHKEGCE